jgi:hypothetical protein
MRKVLAVILAFSIALAFSARPAFAYGIFTAGQTGLDISFPQGTTSLPSAYDFLIVGVTNGRAYTENPYLLSQVLLAQGKPLSLYINMNAPVGSTVRGNTSSPKTCSKSDKVCQAYNYGYNAAAYSYIYAYAQANGALLTQWWLDVETSNSWSATKAINDATLQGAIDYLNAQAAVVGIYSTPSMWNTIAGSSFIPTQTTISVVPNWIPGASAASPQLACLQTITGNGQTWLTQYTSGGFDYDYACP